MLRRKPIAGFFVRFLIVYAVLMAPWPVVRESYAALYRAGCNVLFARFGSDGAVRLRPLGKPVAKQDTEFALTNRRTGADYTFAGSSLQGYNPTAFVVALILATPIPWSRRWRAVLWGLLWVNVYVVLRVVVFLVMAYSGDNSLAQFSPGPVATHVMNYLHWVVVRSFAGWLILPLPIWVAVSFRSGDWSRILYGRGRSSNTVA